MNQVTTQDVREAIIDCFYEAHCADSELGKDEQSNRQYCSSIVKKAFKDQGVDFDNPTKEDLFKVLNALAEFSSSFRSQDIIEKHKKSIIELLSKI